MKKFFAVLAALGLSTLATTGMVKAANPKCPKCKMTLSTKKDKEHTVAVKVNGKTYYDCAACAHHSAAKRKAKTMQCAHCKTTKLSARKDAKHPYAVKVNGKTMYSCCKH